MTGRSESKRARRGETARWIVFALAAALALTGCEDEEGNDTFQRALPDAPLLMFSFPTEAGIDVEAGAVTLSSAPLVGETSSLHAISRATQRSVNQSLRELLEPLVWIVERTRPDYRGSDRAVWQVSPVDDPDEHTLVVRRADDGHFEYSAWSRDRSDAAAPWRFRVYGTTTPSDDGRGRGAVWVNLNNDRKDQTRGKVLALWEEVGGRREVSVALYQATPNRAALAARTRSYLFIDGPQGGLMLYGPEVVDIHDNPAKGATEKVTLLSRWRRDGVGRTDVTARGGDVATDGLTALVRSECWSSPDFAVTYEATHVVRQIGAGLEAVATDGDPTMCPPLDAEVSVPPELIDEPTEPVTPPTEVTPSAAG